MAVLVIDSGRQRSIDPAANTSRALACRFTLAIVMWPQPFNDIFPGGGQRNQTG